MKRPGFDFPQSILAFHHINVIQGALLKILVVLIHPLAGGIMHSDCVECDFGHTFQQEIFRTMQRAIISHLFNPDLAIASTDAPP